MGDLDSELEVALVSIAPGEAFFRRVKTTLVSLRAAVSRRLSVGDDPFVLRLAGSLSCGLSTTHSDLDLSLLPRGVGSREAGGCGAALSTEAEERLLSKLAAALREWRAEGSRIQQVAVKVTRSKAPSLVSCHDAETRLGCDIVVRHGTGGLAAGHLKSALLAQFVSACSFYQPLALAVKEWGRCRGIVDPANGRLNSFTLCLMAAFFLQVQGLLPTPSTTLGAAGAINSAGARADAVDELAGAQRFAAVARAGSPRGTAAVVVAFFAFFRQFRFASEVASVRLGRCCSLAETPVGATDSPRAFVMEDPVEPDENTSRTLADRHLEELRAEINRAHSLLTTGGTWAAVCQRPVRKRLRELKPYLLPHCLAKDVPATRVGAAAGSGDGSGAIARDAGVGSRMLVPPTLPPAAQSSILDFAKTAAPGETRCLKQHLTAAERRSLHHYCEVVGLESSRVGKQSVSQKGAFRVQLRRPRDGGRETGGQGEDDPRATLEPWMDKDRDKLRAFLRECGAEIREAGDFADEALLGQYALPSLAPPSFSSGVLAHAAAGAGAVHSGAAPVTSAPLGALGLRGLTEESECKGVARDGGSTRSDAVVTAADARKVAAETLKVVHVLRSGTALADLIRAHHLIVKRHPTYPCLVQLSYTQTASNMSSRIVQECRGLLLDESRAGDWDVVALPFVKFFNAEEKLGQRVLFDWASARVYEKLDGSLMTMYCYRGVWSVASNKLPAADGHIHTHSSKIDGDDSYGGGDVDGGGGAGGIEEGKAEGGAAPKTFADLFWSTFRSKGYRLPDPVHDGRKCFMFEITHPSHVIIVRHRRPDLVCLGARDLVTLDEIPVEDVACQYGWDAPRRFDEITSLSGALAAARALNPVEQEGFVAVDASWRRLKIKSPGYVALHHLGGNLERSGCSGVVDGPGSKRRQRRLIEIARNNEGSEFLAYYPQLRDEYDEVRARLGALRRFLSKCHTAGSGGLVAGPAGAVSRAVVAACGPLLKAMRVDGVDEATAVGKAKIRDLEDAVNAVGGLLDSGGVSHVDGDSGGDRTCAAIAAATSTTSTITTAARERRQGKDMLGDGGGDTDSDGNARDDASDTSDVRVQEEATPRPPNPFALLRDHSSSSATDVSEDDV